MKKIAILFLSLLIVLTYSSCKKVKGKGDVITETRYASGYTDISLAIEGDVHFTQDSVYSLTIQGQQNVLDVIETPVEESELIIKIKDNYVLGAHEPITIFISAPQVSGINISGSGNFFVDKTWIGSELNMNISGSGYMNVADVISRNIISTISGSGNMKVNAGMSDFAFMTITGSGNIDFLNVQADTVFCDISGSGDISITANEYLDVSIAGSGNVKYLGNPVIISRITGSGAIIHL